MPLLNTATKIYKGSSLATKVYRGTVQVWPPAAQWGPPQSAYTSQIPGTTVAQPQITFGNDVLLAVAGRIVGMRYYRAATAADTFRTLKVWSSAGVLLGTCATAGDTGSGWKSATFADPIAVTAGQTVRIGMEVDTDNVGRTAHAADIVNGDITLYKAAFNSPGFVRPTGAGTNSYFVDLIFEKSL